MNTGVWRALTEQTSADPVSNSLARLLAEHIDYGLSLFDEHGSCVYANRAMLEMTGYSAEELSLLSIHTLFQHPFTDIFPGENQLPFQSPEEEKFTPLKEFSCVHKDGTSFKVLCSTKRILHRGHTAFLAMEVRPPAPTWQDIFRSDTNDTGLSSRLAAEAGNIGAWERDLVTGVVTQNAIASEILGLGRWPTRLAVEDWQKMVISEDLPLFGETVQNAIDSGLPFDMQFRIERKDGELRWVAARGTGIKDAHGKATRMVGVLFDITDRKRAENALRANEERYRILLNSMDEGFCIIEVLFDANGKAVDYRFDECNPVFEKHTGFSVKPGETMSGLFPGFEHKWAGFYGKVATTGEPARHVGYSAALGRWFNVFASRLGGPESRKVALLFKDVSEQKRAEEELRASEERFRMFIEGSPDAILVELHGRFVYVNPAAVTLFGASNETDIVGRLSMDFVAPESRETVQARRQLGFGDAQKTPLIELRMHRMAGTLVDVQVACAKVRWHGESAIQIMLRDVTELKRTQDKLRHMSDRLKVAIEGTGEAIWDWDIVNKTFTFSGGLKAIFGRTEQTFTGAESEWQRLIHPEDLPRVLYTFQQSLEGRTPVYVCEYRLRTKGRSWTWVSARGVVVERDPAGKPLTMTGTLTNINARKEADNIAWRHANLDTLTSLPNRRLFRERLDFEIRKAKRSNRQLALLFIDLDGFKHVNDFYGHDAGDLLLMESAQRIGNCVRETDTVARLGGDEFTVILSDLFDLDHVEFACQKILVSLAEPFQVDTDAVYISGSIGVSLHPLDAMASDDLIRKADQAMYAAKRSGKNQFSYFTREMDEKAHMRLRITNELRHALKEKQLSVYYQPVIDLSNGRIVKAEALLRWHHPRMGHIEPSKFIPMAEESGLIHQIGDWVFREAARCCRGCREQIGAPFQISVNKSPVQFMSQDSDAGWLHYLSEEGLPGSSISVEITEGVLLQASSRVADKLLEYRDAGIQVALDDFGTGYASLSYLQKFHIDYVKIDQSFIRNITSDAGSRTISETIIMMAHKLGQKVIAEGIETQEQLDYLMSAGCDFGQGFLFSHPVPSDELIHLVSNGRRIAASWMH